MRLHRIGQLSDVQDETTAIGNEEAHALALCINKGTRDAVVEYQFERESELQRQASEHLAFIAHELRTGIALVLAGLAAEGETVVAPGYLIDRGHASVASRLTTLGADVVEEIVD